MLDSLTFLQKSLNPSQHARPAAIAVANSGMSCEPTMAEAKQSPRRAGLQFPADGGLCIPGPARDPSVRQQARGFDLQIFAGDFEWAAVRTDSRTTPLA